ncbi:hypothetical protein G6F54_014092 [Rhizopus delemar]|nr:hypothetical protein G6F54_014092 [Rhizopus delemar]
MAGGFDEIERGIRSDTGFSDLAGDLAQYAAAHTVLQRPAGNIQTGQIPDRHGNVPLQHDLTFLPVRTELRRALNIQTAANCKQCSLGCEGANVWNWNGSTISDPPLNVICSISSGWPGR